jgi:citrate synthase
MSDVADSSLAGVVAASTAIAHVDGKRGVALVRGYALPELARRCSYEQAAWLVLEGELPAPAELASFRAELEEGARTSALAATALSGRHGTPEALVAALALTGDDAPDGTPSETTARRVLGRVPDACAVAFGRPPPPLHLPYAGRALRALGAARTDATAERALEVLLVLETEHGLSASTFAARVAASAGASLPAAVAAGAATLGGARHGGATREVQAFLRAAIASGDPGAYASRQSRIPGFGHRIYKVPDPRAPPLLEALNTLEATGATPLAVAAKEVERAVVARLGSKGVYANIDFHAAVLLDALGVAPEAFVGAFALGVACGWLAHAAEQRAVGKLVRPESSYTGPPARPIP